MSLQGRAAAFEGLLQGRTAAALQQTARSSAPHQAAHLNSCPLLTAQSDPSAAGSDHFASSDMKSCGGSPSAGGFSAKGVYDSFADGIARSGSEDMYSSFA
jgi:hypothetical protein